MSHAVGDPIHVYASRGIDLRVSVTTTETTTDFTSITFRAGAITKTGLTADDTTAGFDVDFTLTATDLAIAVGVYTYELKATFGGQVRTVIEGRMTVSEVPST